MVEIKYVDGDKDVVETVESETLKYRGGSETVERARISHFCYDSAIQCFIVYDHEDYDDCMMVPREFVKSIRHIEV